jgi:hypothetical protein
LKELEDEGYTIIRREPVHDPDMHGRMIHDITINNPHPSTCTAPEGRKVFEVGDPKKGWMVLTEKDEKFAFISGIPHLAILRFMAEIA